MQIIDYLSHQMRGECLRYPEVFTKGSAQLYIYESIAIWQAIIWDKIMLFNI